MHLGDRVFLVLSLVPLLAAGCIGTPESPGDGGSVQAPVDENATVAHEVFKGRLVCGVGTPDYTTNLCPVVPGSRNLFEFRVNESLETLFLAMTWEPTSSFGKDLRMTLETRGYNAFSSGGHRYGAASGPPDLVLRVDKDDSLDPEHNWSNISSSLPLQSRVFPAGDMPPTVVLAQDFMLYVIAYYGAPAPKDADPFAVIASEALHRGAPSLR